MKFSDLTCHKCVYARTPEECGAPREEEAENVTHLKPAIQERVGRTVIPSLVCRRGYQFLAGGSPGNEGCGEGMWITRSPEKKIVAIFWKTFWTRYNELVWYTYEVLDWRDKQPLSKP